MVPDAIDQESLIACYKSDPRMTPQKWVRWACDCAERTLEVFESQYPDDTRSRQAVAAARRWVANPTAHAADAAADAAAYAAAHAAHAADAAAHAAYAAAHAAHAAHAAYAAHAARTARTAHTARAARAARTAHTARAATHTADAASERLWQTVKLMEIYHA